MNDVVNRTYGHPLANSLTSELVAEIKRLEGWKAEAMSVLAEWEWVWRTVGRPSSLGNSKASGVLGEVKRLEVLLVQANDAFDECTGDTAKETCEGEPWRQYRTADPADEPAPVEPSPTVLVEDTSPGQPAAAVNPLLAGRVKVVEP